MGGVPLKPETLEAQARDLARSAWTRFGEARRRRDPADARRWLERAHRLLPADGLIGAALAGLDLEEGRAERAFARFKELGERFRGLELLTGLAASALVLGRLADARDAVEAALRANVVTPGLRELAEIVVAQLRLPGWCGLDGDGALQTGPALPAAIKLDGRSLDPAGLPRDWRTRGILQVEGPGGAFLGSPLSLAELGAIEGFAEAAEGGVRGWAWQPADPGRDPMLCLRGERSSIWVLACEPADPLSGGAPFARPRRFEVSGAIVRALGAIVAAIGEDGRNLAGSPLDPKLQAGLNGRGTPVSANPRRGVPATGPAPRSIAVVIPVYRGTEETLACIGSVLDGLPGDAEVIAVEDASPEPALVDALRDLAAAGRIRLIRHGENRGFPAAANAGVRACAGRDVVLLNSDTLVAPGWLGRLRRAAYSAPDVGTATPFSNEGSILSYPAREGGNPAPDLAETRKLDALASRANEGAVAEIPVGVGFCLYVRRDCLHQVGLFREDLFAQGYGEENDFSLRARHAGWRHVAALDVFVAHTGGRSFGDAGVHLRHRNRALVERLHPGHNALVAKFGAADPLRMARRGIDALRWAEGRSPHGAVLFVTHGGGGGVDRAVAARCTLAQAQGLRPIVLRPGGARGCLVESPGDAFPNLRFAVPEELPELAALLGPDRPLHLEAHHLLGHDRAILSLARSLGIPVDAYVHDYASLCPRIAPVGRAGRYCGEPGPGECGRCIATLGSRLDEAISVGDLLARSASELEACRRVVVPSVDAGARLRRHFPGVRPSVEPWEDDGHLPPLTPAPRKGAIRVCVIGAIGVEKGYDVLLACISDAARRDLALEFVVCGFTIDDQRLFAAGNVFITGRYHEAEAVGLIRAQQAQVAFLPSVFPETWCFALSRAWQAGLPAVAFDMGAQAERIRATGRGWVLPPGLSAPAINDAMLLLPPLPQDNLKTIDRGTECQTSRPLLLL